MKTKTMKALGIVFLAVGIAGVVGAVFFWIFHYWAMENGYRSYYDDSLMVACAISGITGLLMYPAIPMIIVSKVRKNRETLKPSNQHNEAFYETVKICTRCGAKHNFNANFCGNCGEKLN
ncbi:MAG: hypothetical protein IJF19_00230 [Clostridia bacterium]|nr:hypothetical protein [Clostridia bacterium]